MSTALEHEFKLHFPGKHIWFDHDDIVGPNVFGELLRPFKAHYDKKADQTTIWYDLVPRSELAALGEKAVANLNRLTKLSAMFGGSND